MKGENGKLAHSLIPKQQWVLATLPARQQREKTTMRVVSR
jgi:hypothetical protein